MHRQLAVEENKIRINGGPRNVLGQQISRIGVNGGGVSLREDNDTLFVAGNRGIISRSRHSMNLGHSLLSGQMLEVWQSLPQVLYQTLVTRCLVDEEETEEEALDPSSLCFWAPDLSDVP